EMSSYAMEVLMNYDFPGNVRELENIIERGVALESSNIILPDSLTLSTFRFGKKEPDPPPNSRFQAVASEEELFERGLEEVMGDLEKQLIHTALEKSDYSKMCAAELLRISFRSLRYKVKKYNIE
ncbi:MAG: sigma-54-dependent Fis family transcriptional regulator, partial [Proteobacteria bacterium]|nr:sigma-54-dependent Fis family transcriptional regulator [Pseudomonadota bacterium]